MFANNSAWKGEGACFQEAHNAIWKDPEYLAKQHANNPIFDFEYSSQKRKALWQNEDSGAKQKANNKMLYDLETQSRNSKALWKNPETRALKIEQPRVAMTKKCQDEPEKMAKARKQSTKTRQEQLECWAREGLERPGLGDVDVESGRRFLVCVRKWKIDKGAKISVDFAGEKPERR